MGMEKYLTDNNSEFFNLARTGKRLLHPVFSFFVFFAIGFIPFVASDALVRLLFDVSTWSRETWMLYTLIVTFGAVYGITCLWVKIVERRKFSSIGFVKQKFPKDYLVGFSIGFLMMSAVVGILALTGNVQFQAEGTIETGLPAVGSVFLFWIGFMIQGGAEEVMTRGWLMQVMGARSKPWIALLITSVLFAVLHLGNQGATVFAAFNLFLFGLFLGLYAIRTGNIWGICGWHSAWNWTMGNFYGLEVSGSQPKGGAILDLQFTGPELLSGGLFGPEGSIITTVVLITGIILVIKKSPNKHII